MKCSVDLYINGNKVDIINSEEFAQQFALTYSFSDLYEPDKVTDTYSKSITLPGTPNNNNIFANIWKLDSDTVEQFNASQLSDFELYLNNELWQSGTVQLTDIVRKDNVYTYKVTLYGAITKVMSMLLNSDIDDESNKLLRSLKYPSKLRHVLTDFMLYRMWNSNYYTGHIYLNDYMNYVPCQNGLYDNFDSSKKLTIRYPWLTGNTPGQDLEHPYLSCTPVVYAESNSASTSGNDKITIASSEDEEFDEYSLRQWRVEYQRPAMRMNKLIQQIATDIAPDASINLDSDFFNSSNPYWYDTYITLSQYTTDADEGTVKANIDGTYYQFVDTNTSYASFDLKFTQTDGNITIFAPDSSTVVYYGNLSGSKTISLEFQIKTSVLTNQAFSNTNPFFKNGTTTQNIGESFNSSLWTRSTWPVYARGFADGYSSTSTPYTNGAYDSSVHSGIYNDNTFHAYGGLSTYWNNYWYEGPNNNYQGYSYEYTIQANDVKNYVFRNYTPSDDGYYGLKWKPFKVNLDVSSLDGSGTISIEVDNINHNFICINNGTTIISKGTYPVLIYLKSITAAPEGTSSSNLNNYFPYSYGYTGNAASLSYNMAIRSGDNYDGQYSGIAPSVVTTEDMFDTTTTQGEILLNYTKLCGLIYDTDSKGNITIQSRNKYFNNYKVFDWSNKVDYSKEINIKPIPFNTRYLEMKYKSGDSYYENKYASEFGLEFGEKKINTGFAFNSQTTQLLDTIFTNTVMAKEDRDDYTTEFRYIGKPVPDNYYGFVKKLWSLPSIGYPCYFSKDGNKKNKTDAKYSLLFNAGTVSNPGVITVDSSVMLVDDASVNGGKFCWLDNYLTDTFNFNRLMTAVSYTPEFTTHYDNYSWDIGYPRISYAGDTTTTYPSGSTVYSRFWEEYISEIYNVKNKILTCYVKLSWVDILNFSFKNFVTINGVLYHPNKLLNINPLSDDPIQVEFIQVQNIAAYTSGQNIPSAT